MSFKTAQRDLWKRMGFFMMQFAAQNYGKIIKKNPTM